MGGLSQESGVRRGKEKANCHFDSSLHFYSVYYVAFLFLPIPTDWCFLFPFFSRSGCLCVMIRWQVDD